MKQELTDEQIYTLADRIDNIIQHISSQQKDDFKNEAVNWSGLSVASIEYRKEVYPKHKDNSAYYMVTIEELAPDNYEFMKEVEYQFKTKYGKEYDGINIYFECEW